jgi:hypothetical protein
MTTTAEARATLDALTEKLAAATAREIALAGERRRLSFDAHAGDAKAKTALDAANKASATIGLEIENLKSASEEGKRRLAEAERADEMAAQRNNASQAAALGESLVRRARKIDEALAIVAAESTAFVADISALNHLGISHPRSEQFVSLGERAMSTSLMHCPLKLRHLGHGEKRNFTETAVGWRDSIARWAAQFLDKQEAA